MFLENNLDKVSVAHGLTILVVDDERAVRDFCSAFLRAEGYNVTAIGDGDKAQKFIQEGELYHIGVFDNNLGGRVTGNHLSWLSRRCQPFIPIIRASSGTEEMIGDYFLKKPFYAQELAETVKAAVRAGITRL